MNYTIAFKETNGRGNTIECFTGSDGDLTGLLSDEQIDLLKGKGEAAHVILAGEWEGRFAHFAVDAKTLRRIARELTHFCNCAEFENKGAKK